ncbi:DUF2336 domain-containing protein [Polymorphum gilvum]|uniref:DUF2336 domain-containing protein n=1 Tax=Polymorphum gilvum (strain LMG 25793 / CGMCC 1.9160 / SL003B-26A1) TaxID=991905 RepID=F2IXQ6_POLGS|nr:DUF2336 domain-containing protein [Polymorphum gilvum]ADZ69387.1 hypothetical protein SL003B_0958 [Polymorphum gilvum SL003B-26A1]
MLDSLIDLARQSSTDARGALMQSIADVFLKGVGKHSEAELRLFGDILLRLLQCTSVEHRAALSRRIAPCKDMPSAVALQLAGDVIAVARPVLEKSQALGEEQLLELARRLDESHLAVLARREDLTPPVSDTLVRRGRTTVWRTIAGNRKIQLSEGAMRNLARQAVKDAVLREDITTRRDLTPAICAWLIPHVNPRTRARLEAVASGRISGEELDAIAARKALRRRLGPSLDTSDATKLWQFVQAEETTLDELMLVLLEDNRLLHAADLLASATRTQKAHVRNAVFGGDSDKIVGFARNVGLKPETFAALVRARCKNLRIPESQADSLIEKYEALTPGRGTRRTDPVFARRRPAAPRLSA